MQKKFFLLLLIVILCLNGWAQDISETDAQRIAQQFLSSSAAGKMRRAPSQAKNMRLAHRVQQAGDTPELYVFNTAGDSGFVIVAGDERTTGPVLGYCDHGTFDYDKAPDALRYLLNSYSKDIAYMRETGEGIVTDRTSLRAPAGLPSKVEPLLNTSWSQNSPYNNDCPIGPTGCVATAIAQIMNYHKWPKQGSGQHTNLNYSSQTVNFSESNYDWTYMPNNNTGEVTSRHNRAVAKLMADIGCAVDMMYRYDESAAYSHNAFVALFANFGYDEGTIHMGSINEKEELAAGRPFYISGCDTIHTERYGFNVIEPTTSHAFVCDGYDEQGLYHYNFGWGGDCDGYYRSNVINPYPGKKGYSFMHEYIAGIKPANYQRPLVNGVFYDIIDDSSVLVASSNGAPEYAGEMVIPATIVIEGKTYNVTGVRPTAFLSRMNSNDKIEKSPNLTSLTIEAQMDDLPAEAFSGLTGLQTLTIKNVKNIGDGLFCNMPNLTTLTLGEGVEKIGARAFMNCEKLATVTLPVGLASIADSAFNGCKELYTINYPEGLKTIGREAFWGTNMSSIKLPRSLETLGVGAFGKSKVWYIEGGLPDLAEIPDSAFYQCQIGSLTIPSTVKRIGKWAFFGNSLWSINFQSTGFVIDERAFSSTNMGTVTGLENAAEIFSYGINGLKGNITIQKSTKYHPYAISGSFDEIYLPADVTDFDVTSVATTRSFRVDANNPIYAVCDSMLVSKDGTRLFCMPSSDAMSYGIVPPTVTTIGPNAIKGRGRLMLPTSVTTIEENEIPFIYNTRDVYCMSPVPPTFPNIAADTHQELQYHSYLHIPVGSKAAYEQALVWRDFNNYVEDLTISDSYIYTTDHDSWTNENYVTVIGRNTAAPWNGHASIPSTVVVGDTRLPVKYVSESTFQGDLTLKSFTSSPMLKSVNSFRGCTSLTTVELGMGIDDLYYNLFEGCTSLKDLTMHGKISSIGGRTFAGCTSLKSLSFTNALQQVREEAFAGSGLEKIALGGKVDYIEKGAFKNCVNLKTITGMESVATIPDECFAGSGIETVKVPAACSYIYPSAFNDCKSLYAISVDKENRYFASFHGDLYGKGYDGNWMIQGIHQAEKDADGQIIPRTQIYLSSQSTTVPYDVLKGDFTELVIPSSIENFGMQCFFYLQKLATVTNLSTTPIATDSWTFSGDIYTNCTLQVPKGCKEAYAQTDPWKRFKNIVEIDPKDFPEPKEIEPDEPEEPKPEADDHMRTAVVVWMKDGSTHTLYLTQEPVITVQNRNLHIESKAGTAEIPIASVLRYTFDRFDATGVTELSEEDTNVALEHNQLVVTGLKIGDNVDIYDVSGKLIQHVQSRRNGSYRINLSNLSTGVYVVKANQTTIKFMKR